MISTRQLLPEDGELIQQLAKWYQEEWNIPVEKTIESLQSITTSANQFQLMLYLDDLPVATGGIYTHVGLLEREPRLKIYNHWLALVYVVPAHRGKGYGSALCHALQTQAQQKGIYTIHLFTDTAESFYKKLSWKLQERLDTGGRQLAIMHLQLS